MISPAIALTWEIWRRHRPRLITMVLTIFAFALFYPKLCALSGLNLSSPNMLDDLVKNIPAREPQPVWLWVFRIITLLFLLLGPLVCMALSLLYVIWIFTLTDFDPKQPFLFPSRLFTLPVSTTFLAGWLMVAGVAVLLAVYLCWTRIVQLPHIDVFDGYANYRCALAWIALLVLSQATVWSLNSFPSSRMLALSALLYCFVGYPTLSPDNFLRQNQPLFLSALLLAGGALAHTGLSKVRHGEWQTSLWGWRRLPWRTASGAKALQEFRSPLEAQLWLNWRSFGSKIFFSVCALTWTPIILLAPEVMLHGRLDIENTHGLCVYLLVVPVLIHFAHGMTLYPSLLPFVALRPLTNGEIVTSILKTLARSTLLSWVVTGMALAVVPLLGDVAGAVAQIKSLTQDRQLISLTPLLLLGLIFLTWRFSVINLGLSLTGKSWAAHVPALTTLGSVIAYGSLNYLAQHSDYRETLFRVLVAVLVSLLVLKIILARWAFRVALRKQLLVRSAVKKYLALWMGLGLLFMVPPSIIFRHERGVFPLCLFILLLLPLARIGFAPIALNLSRHR